MKTDPPTAQSKIEIADDNRSQLRDAGVFTVNLIGGPGCGKTSLISATVQQLILKRRIGIITADPFTHRDADRLKQWGDQVLQIDTGASNRLTARHVRAALKRLNLRALDILMIENISSLIGPPEVDLGEDAKVCMLSVAAGDDKAAKHPDAVQCAKLIILNKIDLLSVMPFGMAAFENDVRRLNPSAKMIELSTRTGEGLDGWLDWLLSHSQVQGG